MVIGGWAVAFHGRPRYTKDVDILIGPGVDNARLVLEALGDFGFGDLDISIADFAKPEQIIQLGLEPNRIDLLTSVPAVSFEDAYKDSITVNVEAVAVRVIGVNALIANKETVGRPQDIADVKFLKSLKT